MLRNAFFLFLAGTFAVAAEVPLLEVDFNRVASEFPNQGRLRELSLRGHDASNHLATLSGEPASGVSGESSDLAVDLRDGACLGMIKDRGGIPLLEDASEFTLCAWYKTSRLTATERWPVIFRNLPEGDRGGVSIVVSPEGKPIASFGSEDGELVKTALSDAVWLIPDETWRFFGVVYDGNNLRYFSGSTTEPVEEVASVPVVVRKVAAPTDANTSFFGQHGGSDTFEGWVDNLRLFDRTLDMAQLEEYRRNDMAEQE